MKLFKELKFCSVKSSDDILRSLKSIGFEVLSEQTETIRLVHPKWKWSLDARIKEQYKVHKLKIKVVQLPVEEEMDDE